MNRPRNRQPRPPRGNDGAGGRGGGRGGGGGGGRGGRPPQDRNHRWTAGTPQQAAGTVPTIQQVIPGASVYIILKEDQPTGRETQGTVQELLTRGNHPRGIKVRLRGGLVGRVQRMSTEVTPVADVETATSAQAVRQSPLVSRGGSSQIRYRDVRLDEDEEPPQRSLADYLPAELNTPEPVATAQPLAKCPFCEEFEGDEVAVSYHIDQKHLS
ncbi:hypothetical protein LIA77_08816 [Sarocladium implicatum]|nr:hypothetical protein LIA77_08816 [Sarocladium implicatum]